MNVDAIRQYQIAIFMYQIYNDDLSVDFGNLFVRQPHVVNRSTRSSADFYIQTHHLNSTNRCFVVKGPSTWNGLSNEVKQSDKLLLFKCRLKNDHLFTNQVETHPEEVKVVFDYGADLWTKSRPTSAALIWNAVALK